MRIPKCLRQILYRKPIDFWVDSLSRCDDGFVANSFRCSVNRKQCIEAVIIKKVLRFYQVWELWRTCDGTGANVMVSQKVKSLRQWAFENFFLCCLRWYLDRKIAPCCCSVKVSDTWMYAYIMYVVEEQT